MCTQADSEPSGSSSHDRSMAAGLTRWLSLPLLMSALMTGCGHATPRVAYASYLTEAAAANVRLQPLRGLPYNPVVFHLDLSILAYQLYGQSLVWPFDPYYNEASDRSLAMTKVHAWARGVGRAQVAAGAGLSGYRGPGVLAGFANNRGHEPIIYQYGRIYPWSHVLNNPDGTWVEYRTPPQITDRIGTVSACVRTIGKPLGNVTVAGLPPRRDAVGAAPDQLLVFEGGTGDKGERGQPASQSLMGFILLRSIDGEGSDYDAHIAFRGSRSRSALRSAWLALSDTEASGNPDWITDMGVRLIEAPDVASRGSVFRGMAQSIRSTLPQLVACLAHGAALRGGTPPRNLYVTGHSLGGALAQMLASAVLMGDMYGPHGQGARMPSVLRAWPWDQLKLISFGAPRIGDETWARELTTERLAARFWDSDMSPYDAAGVGMTDPPIVARLTDPDLPAAYRVLLPSDPVTTGKTINARHVGETIYLEEPTWSSAITPEFEAHEPTALRAKALEVLRDPRIPTDAWRYHTTEALTPTYREDYRGSAAERDKLVDTIRQYHERSAAWFDLADFERAVALFGSIVDGP